MKFFIYSILLSLSLHNLSVASSPTDEEQEVLESPRGSTSEEESEFFIEPSTEINGWTEFELCDFLEKDGTKIAFLDLDKTSLRDPLLLHNLPEKDQDAILDECFQSDKFACTADEFEHFKSYIKEKGDIRERIKQSVLINEETRTFIKTLKRYGVIVVGLTARNFKYAQETDENLKRQGINFSKLSGLGKFKVSDSDYPEEVGFFNGKYHTHGKFYKALVIPLLVDFIATELDLSGPFYCAHFDDSEGEISAFSKIEVSPIQGRSITCAPVLYNGLFEYMDEIFHEKRHLLHQEIDKEWIAYKSLISLVSPLFQTERTYLSRSAY